jgi:hypothetical protein
VIGWPLVTAVDDWLHAHRKLVLGLCILSMALSTAHYARFIRLPELWHLPAALAWLVPALRYGFWEAAITPKLRERRARLEGQSHD